MSCIQERIQHSMPYNYIWICFNKEDFERVPVWLKHNSSIQFVVPNREELGFQPEDDTALALAEAKTQTETIPASLFLGKMVAILGIKPPTLLSNPALYFSELIKKSLPDNEDVFYLRRWAERMGARGSNETESEKSIHLLELASARKDYKSAIALIDSLTIDSALSSSDYLYILQSIIKQLLDQEEIVSDADIIIDLRKTVVAFLTSHKTDIQSKDIYKNVIEKLLDITPQLHPKYREELLMIVQKISELLSEGSCDGDLLIRSLRLAYLLNRSKDEKIQYLNRIIEITQDIDKLSEYALNVRATSLLGRMKYSQEFKKANSDFIMAQTLAEKTNNIHIKMKVFTAQIELGQISLNVRHKKRLQESAIHEALSYNHHQWRSEILATLDAFTDANEVPSSISKSVKTEVLAFLDEMQADHIENELDIIHYTSSLSNVVQWLSNEDEIMKVIDRLLFMGDFISGNAIKIYNFDIGLALSDAVQKLLDSSDSSRLLYCLQQLKTLSEKDLEFEELYLHVIECFDDDNRRNFLIVNGFEDDLGKIRLKSTSNDVKQNNTTDLTCI